MRILSGESTGEHTHTHTHTHRHAQCTHTHTHTHKRTRSSRHGARRIQGRREGEMIVVCVWRIGSKGEKEGGEKERMEDDRRGRGARVLNHCVLGDYFPRSLSHTHTHTHTTAGGAQARSLCCSLSTLQWEHIFTAERFSLLHHHHHHLSSPSPSPTPPTQHTTATPTQSQHIKAMSEGDKV